MFSFWLLLFFVVVVDDVDVDDAAVGSGWKN